MAIVDCYPWAVPAKEQREMFDKLSSEEQLEMVRQSIIKGEESGDAGILDMEEILTRAKRKAGLLPEKE